MRHGSCGVIEGLKAILLDQAANADIAITGEMKKMFRHTARVKAARINQSIAADEEITAPNKKIDLYKDLMFRTKNIKGERK